MQHHNPVLHMPAPGGWGGREQGVMRCIADARHTATMLQGGRCTQRGPGPVSFMAKIDRAVLHWAKQTKKYGK